MKKFYNTVKKFTYAFVVAALAIFSYMYDGERRGWEGFFGCWREGRGEGTEGIVLEMALPCSLQRRRSLAASFPPSPSDGATTNFISLHSSSSPFPPSLPSCRPFAFQVILGSFGLFIVGLIYLPPPVKHRWEVKFMVAQGWTLRQWFSYLSRHNFAIDPIYWHRALFITVIRFALPCLPPSFPPSLFPSFPLSLLPFLACIDVGESYNQSA